jgi:heme exporter protein A
MSGASAGLDRVGVDFDRVDVVEVTRQFGRRRALSRVTLSAAAGDVVALLGPNGAGKSTLLAVLSTLMRPTSGTVRYGGATASELGDALRGAIGWLSHELFLYGDLTARENLDFAARLYGSANPDAAVTSALETSGLTERADERVGNFSRGMRQRLSLERALLHRPRLVLLDEPFTGLDDVSVERLVARIGGLRNDGAIVFVATHDLAHASRVSSRAVRLEAGKLQHASLAGVTA